MRLDPYSRFKDFHANNPDFYELFKKFAFEAMTAGAKRLSAAFIFERIRWEALLLKATADYKANNDYRAYYARMFMEDHPALGDVFATREVRSVLT